MSATRSEQNYSYKNDFQNWRENQDFGRQNILMSRPPLDSTPIVTNTINGKMSPIDSIPVRTKTPDPTPQTRPTESSSRLMYYSKIKGKAHVPVDPESDPSSSDSSSRKSDLSDDSNYIKSKRKKRDTKKNFRNTRNGTCQTHRRAILIRLTTVTIYASDAKRRAIGKRILSIYAQG